MNIQTQNEWFLYDGLDQDFRLTGSHTYLTLRKIQKITIISYLLVEI